MSIEQWAVSRVAPQSAIALDMETSDKTPFNKIHMVITSFFLLPSSLSLSISVAVYCIVHHLFFGANFSHFSSVFFFTNSNVFFSSSFSLSVLLLISTAFDREFVLLFSHRLARFFCFTVFVFWTDSNKRFFCMKWHASSFGHQFYNIHTIY